MGIKKIFTMSIKTCSQIIKTSRIETRKEWKRDKIYRGSATYAYVYF